MTIKHINYSYSLLSRTFVHVLGEFQVFTEYVKHQKRPCPIYIYAPNWFVQHFRTDALWKRAYMLALLRRGIKAEVITETRSVKADDIIIWRPSQSLIPHAKRFTDDSTRQWVDMAVQMERRGAKIYPSSKVIAFFENKVNMHTLFCQAGVRCPLTIIASNTADYNQGIEQVGFPFIVKGSHSFSSLEIQLIKTQAAADQLCKELFLKPQIGIPTTTHILRAPVIIQQFLNIRRDLRVVFVGDKLIFSYWRVNSSSDWQPTATRFGSNVLFEDVPLAWQETIISVVKKIDFPWGAFDVAWENDALETEPFILEVSPCFDPNPPPPEQYKDNYYSFKYEMNIKNNWYFHHWKSIQEVADSQINYLLQRLA